MTQYSFLLKPLQNEYTVSEMIERYSEELLSNNPQTELTQRSHLKWWRKEIGQYYLSQTRPALLAVCRKKLLDGYTSRGMRRKPSTVNRYFSTLSRVFSVAIREWEWLDVSPLRHIAKLKETSGRTRFLSQEELNRLLLVCQNSPNRDLHIAVVLAVSTCARQMEIMRLRWEEVDLDQGIIILKQTKNKICRSIPLQDYALRLVRQRSQTMRCNAGLIFPSQRKPQQPVNLRVSWKQALVKADINDFRWHDLRHTGASYLAMQGASISELSEILGHKTLQMVKRYAHLSVPHTMQLVARMNRTIFQDSVYK